MRTIFDVLSIGKFENKDGFVENCYECLDLAEGRRHLSYAITPAAIQRVTVVKHEAPAMA